MTARSKVAQAQAAVKRAVETGDSELLTEHHPLRIALRQAAREYQLARAAEQIARIEASQPRPPYLMGGGHNHNDQ